MSLDHVREDFARRLGDPLELRAENAAAAVIEIRDVRRLYSVDLQFVGQTHLLRVPLERHGA